MRQDEVPQEGAPLLEGQRKVVYVVDDAGRYAAARSGGSEAEITVTEEAVAWFAEQAATAKERVLRGEASPLEYHMLRIRMDVPTLAQATGLWKWRVRRHLRPDVFARLREPMLRRYAEAMNLNPDELRRIE